MSKSQHRHPLRQEQERHARSNDGRAGQAQPSYTFILSSRTRQPAAQPHGSGIVLQIRDIVTELENDDRVKVVVFESAVDGFLSESLRLPREL